MGITERIDQVTHIPAAYRNERPPAPRSVKIELTGRCNYACRFCARSNMLRDVADMDIGLFTRTIHEMRAAGVEELGLFYLGESFMVKWLPDAIKCAKDAGFEYVFLTTNGSLCNEKNLQAVMDAGLDSLKFSFNYSDAEQLHDIARVKRGYYSKVIDSIKTAHAVREAGGYKCGLYASFIEYDGEQREKMIDAVAQIQPFLDEVYGLPLYGQAGPQDSPSAAAGMTPTGGNTGRADNPVPAVPCWAVFTEGHITYDGKMSACCWDHNDGLTMGDLKEESFMDAWHSEKFQSLRLAHLSGDVRGTPCEACVAYA
jgi:MoaA/NifB/PqqE/SkfB family radical SAM enzyme